MKNTPQMLPTDDLIETDPLFPETPKLKNIHQVALLALLKRLQGYTIHEYKTVYVNDKDGNKVLKEAVEITKEVGPDLSTILFVLTNRDGRHWKQKQSETLLTTSDPEKPLDLSELSDHVLCELAALQS